MNRLLLIILFLFSILSAKTVKSKQIHFNVKKENPEWHFNIKWLNEKNKIEMINFKISSRLMRHEDKVLPVLKPTSIAQYQAREINRFAKKHPSYRLKAVVYKKRGLSVVGTKEGRAKAVKIAQKASEEFVEMNEYFFYKEHNYIPDHIKHSKKYARYFTPIVNALGGPTKDPRIFAQKALTFVQTIPYELRGAQYRLPISILARNRGDCDSKSTFYLSLMHNAYPNMDLAMVYIKGHAFVALGINPIKGDKTFKYNKKRWVAVEPVGPKLNPIGQVSKISRRKLSFDKYVIRVIKKS